MVVHRSHWILGGDGLCLSRQWRLKALLLPKVIGQCGQCMFISSDDGDLSSAVFFEGLADASHDHKRS